MNRISRVLASLMSSALALAVAYGCGSDDAVSGAPDAASDAPVDGTLGIPDGGEPLGDGAPPGPSCAAFADAAAPYESLGTAIVHGSDIEGSFCARVKIRSGSYNHQSPSDLVLDLQGIQGSYSFSNPAATSGGFLIVYVGLATTGAGTSSSTDPGECGDVFTSVLLTPPASDHHCEADAGGPSGCPYGCARVCSGSCDGVPCKPIPQEVGYEAALSGNCLGVITSPRGAWKVTLTSLEPTGHFPPYTAHGVLEGTLLERNDAGTPATLTVSF